MSPLTAYTGYASYEIDQFGEQLSRPWLVWPLRALTQGVGRWLARARIDRCVQVNNWLLSTNIYPPDWAGEELPAVTRLLVDRFPDHAIGFRSLNRFSNPVLIERLLDLGYLPVPSRQVYLFDGRTGGASEYLKKHNTRLDAGLLRRRHHQLVPASDLAPKDFERLEHLYKLLYLDKYCPLNPHYSADWLRCGHRDGWLELHALRNPSGILDGVVGWISQGGIITAPIVGYDTALPQSLGLYRQITRLCLQAAADRHQLLNFSSGAAHFKRLRGGLPEIEYSLVLVRHLPPARQRVWRLLSQLLHTVGIPILRRYQL